MMRGMERGIHKICGHVLLEPYTSSLQVSCHYTSAQSKNTQNLPKLPVPKLSDTLQKYLKSVRPHLNDDEFACTTSLVKDFENGDGKKLQDFLLKKAEKSLNWLEEWWLTTAYLGYRDPVTIFSSPGLVFPFRKFNCEEDQLRYAAKTLLAALEYKALIDGDKIPLEKMGKNPLDMAQYKKIFGTCRIPLEKVDKISYNSNTKHITVVHNNHFFHMDLWGEDNVLLNECQIIEQLKEVIAVSQIPACDAIGVLTSENRDTWAKAYQLLIADNVNKASLKDIETSIVVLCLDQPVGLWDYPNKEARQNLAAAQTIHGGGAGSNGNNRWFDKTVQFIVGADGLTGLTYEHSPAEGQPIAVLTDFLINYIDKQKADEKSSSKPSSKPKPPKKLDFNVNCEVMCMIEAAQQHLDKLACDLELNCFTYDYYGKNFIKSQKMSPDSYLQMAMQYAFYRLYRIPAAHYESAATRMFAGGRTETIRSCSIESIDFAKKMLDECVSPKDKVAAMKKAIQAHKDYTVQALQGLGVDRHLLGLKLAAVENGMKLHKLYSDVGFVKSSTMRISTSQVACKCDGFMCYAPLVPNGYATCYNPRNDDVNFATSSFSYNSETSCVAYRSALEDSLRDMHDLLLHNTPSKL